MADSQREFTRLLEPLLDPAYRLALHLSRNAADAEDLVQEAALLAFRHFARFEPGTNFKAWYFRILVNRFYSRIRQRPAEVLVDDAALSCGQPATTEGNGCYSRIDDPATTVMARIDAQTIADAIASLPEEFRAVCAMYLVDDLAYRDIAAALGVPVGTVRSRLHRGRRILQASLRTLAADRGLGLHDWSTREGDDAGI